jgi:hypothetical protein
VPARSDQKKLCNDFPRAAKEEPNQSFRTGMQSLGRAAGQACGIPPNAIKGRRETNRYFRKLATTCNTVSRTNKTAKSITIVATSARFNADLTTTAQRQCFDNKVTEYISNGAYACFVASQLPASQSNWTPVPATAPPCVSVP